MSIVHPLSVNTQVVAQMAQCPCKGSPFKEISGQILRVITNHSGIWYYLANGSTVKSDAVIRVIG